MRVLITGAAGFLGSHLTDRFLRDGHQVVGLDNFITGHPENIAHLTGNEHFEFLRHNISNYTYVAGPLDGVLHFASPASPIDYLEQPIPTLKVGALGTHNALGIAKAKGARFFLASTSEVYGDPLVHPQPESYWGNVNPTGPRACYDEGKRAAEALVFDFERATRAEVRVARIFNTYGPRMRADDGRVVSNVICQALAGDDITVYGDGRQTRSFCYVDDMIDGLMRLMAYDGERPGAVNLGNPTEFRINDLVAKVVGVTGSRSSVVTRPLPIDDPRRRRPDIRRAKELLGWSPRTGLDTGLKPTIAWFADEAERTRTQLRSPARAGRAVPA